MTTLSPKATRFIAFAMQYASEPDRAIWDAIDRDTSRDLPAAVVRAALNALQLFEARLRARLETLADEDELADVSNDLSFVRSVERGLEQQQQEARVAA